MLLTTHYMDEAERLCDRVAIISHGRVVCEDTPAQRIQSHLAAEALQLECTADEEAALLGDSRLVCQRLRCEGHLTVFSHAATALADTIRHRPGGDARPLILRPSNLEDVFLAGHRRLARARAGRCGGRGRMSVSLRYAWSVWQRNATLYGRTWKLNLLPNFFEPVFDLTAIGVGVGAYISNMGGMSYVEFLAPGLVVVAAMNGASFEVTYNVYVRLNFEKTYDAILTAPLEPDDLLLGEVMWAMTRVAIYGGSCFVAVALFGLAPLPGSLLAIPVIPLAGLLFAALGLCFSLRVPNVDLFSFYFTLFITPLFLLSGVFFPLEERLGGVWLSLAEVLPRVHPVRLARAAFHGRLIENGGQTLWDLAFCLVVSGPRSSSRSRA